MGITSSRLNLKDSLINGQNRDIEGTATHIKDEDISLSLRFLVQTVCDGGGSRFVDNTENLVERKNC
jgi:hypothetical protein